jgi:hypothetical protein
MRKFASVVALVALTVSLAACGASKEEEQAKKAAEEAKKAAEQVEAAAKAGGAAGVAGMAKGMEQFAEAMQGMQKSADGKEYTPVSFRDLQALLPEVGGWERGEPEGEMMSSPVKFSQTEVTYTKDEARVQVKIVDTTMSALLTMPYQMFLATGYSKESSHGYEKATSISGNPGWVKWNSQDKNAELGVIVGKRFMVTAEGQGVTDVKTVENFLSKIDLGKLAGMK